MPKLRLGNRSVDLPRSRVVRIAIGILLILGGIVGFLPVLGFWMAPLGFVVLAADIPIIRRINRRVYVFIMRWWVAAKRRFGQAA